MVFKLAGMTRRVMRGVLGAAAMAMHEGARLKDALAAAGLLWSPHTEGMTIALATEIVWKARAHKLDPFDLWMVLDAYLCEDVNHAVFKALELRALYAGTVPRGAEA